MLRVCSGRCLSSSLRRRWLLFQVFLLYPLRAPFVALDEISPPSILQGTQHAYDAPRVEQRHPSHPRPCMQSLRSPQDEVKAELVLQGATRLASALREGASPEARRNCSLVACNLAVGKVSRSTLLEFSWSGDVQTWFRSLDSWQGGTLSGRSGDKISYCTTKYRPCRRCT